MTELGLPSADSLSASTPLLLTTLTSFPRRSTLSFTPPSLSPGMTLSAPSAACGRCPTLPGKALLLTSIDIDISIYDIDSLSNVKKVDIERAIDIEVFDIECFVRYRTSDTRYRGAKVPDELPTYRDSVVLNLKCED